MISRIKTLIVFDTNALRRVVTRNVIAYNSFSFGKAFNEIQRFVKENRLEESVRLAVPLMVINELIVQKLRQYEKDIGQIREIFERLAGLPYDTDNFLKPRQGEFDFPGYIESEAQKFIAENSLLVFAYKEEHAHSILTSMIVKVLDSDAVKSPFRPKDAGFKDNIIWETLMHFENIKDVDKVIFVTRDSDYKQNCYDDFIAKWQRFLSILGDETLVISELQKDYGNYIEYRKVYEYAGKDYFDNYLRGLLTPTTFVDLDGESLKIENYRIANHCSKVEIVADDDGDFVSPVILSDIVIYTTHNGTKVEVNVLAKTTLTDADYMEIEETTFEPALR